MGREINLYDGKYAFRESDDGRTVECLRNGEWWRNFIGDKAVHALLDYACELQDELDKLTNVPRKHLGRDK